MSQANTQSTSSSNVVKLPVKRKARSRSRKQPQRREPKRDIVKAVTQAVAMRDAFKAVAARRRELAAEIEAAAHEEKFGGLRSLAILTAISSILVMLLVAGVST